LNSGRAARPALEVVHEVRVGSLGIHLDFEDLLAAAIASVVIKRPKKRKFTSRRRP